MDGKYLSEAIDLIDEKYINEAALYIKNTDSESSDKMVNSFEYKAVPEGKNMKRRVFGIIISAAACAAVVIALSRMPGDTPPENDYYKNAVTTVTSVTYSVTGTSSSKNTVTEKTTTEVSSSSKNTNPVTVTVTSAVSGVHSENTGNHQDAAVQNTVEKSEETENSSAPVTESQEVTEIPAVTEITDTYVYDASVEAYIPVAEFLFSELDKGTLKTGDIIYDDDFKELAGEESELYRNSHSSYNYIEDIKPSQFYNIEYLLEIVSEDDPLYEYLKDTEKFDESFGEIADQFRELLTERNDLNIGDILSPAGLEHWKAIWDSYELISAYIPDDDTIIIDNGTGFLLEVEGVLITRNGKNVENDYISVPEKFGYDGDNISVYEKVNGHDNVYRWRAGM